MNSEAQKLRVKAILKEIEQIALEHLDQIGSEELPDLDLIKGSVEVYETFSEDEP